MTKHLSLTPVGYAPLAVVNLVVFAILLACATFVITGGRVDLASCGFAVAYGLGMSLLPNRDLVFGDTVFFALLPTVAFLSILSFLLKTALRPQIESGMIKFFHYSAISRWPNINNDEWIEPRHKGFGSFAVSAIYGWGRPVCKFANMIFGVPHELVIEGRAERAETIQKGLGFLVSFSRVRIVSYEFV